MNDKTWNILFACTTLNHNSTFSRFSKTIHTEIEKYISNFVPLKKNAYFIYKLPDSSKEQIKEEEGIKLLKDYHYNLETIVDQTLIDYLKEHPKTKFDIIVLSQCSNLIDTITYGSYNFLNKKELFDNCKIFYQSLMPKGIVFNFYYFIFKDINKLSEDESKKYVTIAKIRNLKKDYPVLVDFEFFYSPNVFEHIDTFIFLFKIMNRLFVKLDTGVYQKIPYSQFMLDKILNEEYENTIIDIHKLLELETKNILDQIDEQYLSSYHPLFTQEYDYLNLYKLQNKSI